MKKSKMKLKPWPCAWIALLLWSGSVQATMLEEWDTIRLTKESDSIHVGRVISQWSNWDPDQKMVYTYTRLQVQETLKGQTSKEVLIRQPGGQTEDIGMVVHGVANFRNHEKALVFLRNDSKGAPTLSGMAQGKFSIYRDPKSGKDLAIYRAPKNVEYFQRNITGQIQTSPDRNRSKVMPLQDLLNEIRSASENKGGSSSN